MTALVTGPKPLPSLLAVAKKSWANCSRPWLEPAGAVSGHPPVGETPDSADCLQDDVCTKDLGCAHDVPPGCRTVGDADVTAVIDVAMAKRVSPVRHRVDACLDPYQTLYFHEFSTENRAEGDFVFVTLPIARAVLQEGR